MISDARLLLVTLSVAAAEMLFWLYTFYYIDHHTNLMGDGLEWMAEVPMTIIFVTPALPPPPSSPM